MRWKPQVCKWCVKTVCLGMHWRLHVRWRQPFVKLYPFLPSNKTYRMHRKSPSNTHPLCPIVWFHMIDEVFWLYGWCSVAFTWKHTQPHTALFYIPSVDISLFLRIYGVCFLKNVLISTVLIHFELIFLQGIPDLFYFSLRWLQQIENCLLFWESWDFLFPWADCVTLTCGPEQSLGPHCECKVGALPKVHTFPL